jgi:acetylornithine/succinyldiaminopimelate/putrescine aminotransferase
VGLPLGAFIASKSRWTLSSVSLYWAISPLGGHPLSCAAGLLPKVLLKENLVSLVAEKEKLFKERLIHPSIDPFELPACSSL